jgi:hypothetical protein
MDNYTWGSSSEDDEEYDTFTDGHDTLESFDEWCGMYDDDCWDIFVTLCEKMHDMYLPCEHVSYASFVNDCIGAVSPRNKGSTNSHIDAVALLLYDALLHTNFRVGELVQFEDFQSWILKTCPMIRNYNRFAVRMNMNATEHAMTNAANPVTCM